MKSISQKISAQDIQDAIFRNMPVEKKLRLGMQLWKLAMLIAGKKIKHELKKSASAFTRARQDSK